jgi:lipopolysaccharide transport system permease protein/teichoic acid transport system permease protein
MLLLGISWFTSSVSLFIDDVRKSVTLLVQFGFWMTPVLWSASNLPENHRWIAAINPLTHIVDGYRESITSSGLIWDDPGELAYFWFVCLSCNVLGALTFSRLRPHFAEVL